jgi:hypothetical protein
MKRWLGPSLGVALLLSLCVRSPGGAAQAPNDPRTADHFDKKIAPLLAARCLDCHGGSKPRGGLDLSRRKAAREGGKSGQAIVPGNAAASLLWKHVQAGKMPPKKPLAAEEKRLLKEWIDGGAAWGSDPIDPFRFTSARRGGYDWWSLQPVVRPALPKVKQAAWARNGVDHFILAKLEEKGLAPSPEADRPTLIRRLSFNLTGLPPTPEEVTAFVQDPGPDAYECLVDRLLASPQYGERWARHWLDVARFGESNGFEHDELRRNAWPYRDWVIQALNRDLPFDQFARLQLAGDVLLPGDAEGVVATGFLVAGGYDSVGQQQQSQAMKAVVRQDELEDLVGTVGQAFLGLTVQCARCHDHKFDAVRQEEYYRLTAALGGVRHGEREVTPPGGGKARRENRQRVYAVVPRPPGETHVLLRGNPARKGKAVTPGGVAALGGPPADFGLTGAAGDAERRRKLAEWVTHPKNPLFARVLVNRLWHHHFGKGLVDTPNDFGFNGGRPSHPQLLDWLTDELARQRFSLKALHRLLVRSAAYRQSSRWDPVAARVDAGNRLLWRMSPRRLEAEAVRDAMLAVAGQLNRAMGGPGFQDFRLTVRGGTYHYEPADRAGPESRRRSVYRTWARSGRSPLLDSLDCPDPSTATHKRSVTTTPLQALTLLNSAFALRTAERFAARIQREAGGDVGRQLERAYRLAYGRPPTGEEAAAARPVVRAHGLRIVCRALLNSNEFLYVD